MIEFIKEIAWEAGEICLAESQALSSAGLEFKGTRDLVTFVDKKVENFLINKIKKRFPQHNIIGEETGSTKNDNDNCWIIDPIDGTTSYFHKQPFYSVSIAWQQGGVTQAAVVYGPALGQMFTAIRGQGAWLNAIQRLSVSPNTKMINSVLATGFACLRAGREVNNLHYLAKILPKIRDFRRCGSAALDLAYVAAGKVDGFWEMDLNIYDVAAGILLIEEAGGLVSDMNGGDDFPGSGIVAAGVGIYDDLMAALAE